MEEERALEEEYDEKVREERLKREEEERELARGERIKQREMMKELRAQRAIEREWKDNKPAKRGRSPEPEDEDEADGDDDDADEEDYEPLSKRQKSSGKKSNGKKGKSKSSKEKLFDDDLYNPWHSNDHESDEDYAPSRDEIEASTKENNKDKEVAPSMKGEPKERNNSAMHFTTALIKVGSKSFKDPQVEKPVRKSAGLLLETAGKSLLQRRMPPAATAADRKFNSLLGLGGANSGGLGNSSQPAQLSFGLAPEKISFGLYDGNLGVEPASGEPKEEKPDTEEDKTATSSSTSLSTAANGGNPAKSPASTTTASTKRVFSNWGGAFFKKNLDYRANTNKILEKMSMASSSAAATGAAPSNGDGFKSAFSPPPGPSSPTKRPFEVMGKLASPPGGSSSASEAAKKFKSGFTFGSSFGQSPPPGPPNT